jgi:hypothetical protein
MTGRFHRLSRVRHRTLCRLSAISALALAAFGAVAAPAVAGSAFSITPIGSRPYFVFNARPGATISDQVRIVNVSGTTGTVRLSAVDASTGQTGGIVYLSTAAPRRAVGSWIKLSTRSLLLGPHASTVVPFTVTVPAGTAAGEYVGGLVAAPVVPTATHTGGSGGHHFRVLVIEIAIVAVQLNLPGPAVQRMAITSAGASGRPGYQTIVLGLANTGSTLVKGHGALSVSGASGAPLLSQSFPLDTFLPHTSISYPVYVHGRRLAPGTYRVRVTVTYGHGAHTTRSFPLTISAGQVRQTYGSAAPHGLGGSSGGSSPPIWLLVLVGALLVIGGVGGSAFFFRHRYVHTPRR